jgi:hypothetical protein
MTATYAKELVDLAGCRTEEVIAPIAGLLENNKTA